MIPHPKHSEQVCSIVSGLLFSFCKKFTQGPTQSCWRDVCGCYFWNVQRLWNYCLWLAVLTVLRLGKDDRYGFEVSWKHWRLEFVFSLLGRFIWFCKTAKLSKSVYSNSKEWPNTNHICIDIWMQTTCSGMHFPLI